MNSFWLADEAARSRQRQILEVLALPLTLMIAVVLFASMYGGLIFVGLLWVVPAWIACEVALNKDRGRWWGFWLGWPGVIVAAILSPGRSHELNELEAKALRLQIQELEQRLASPEQ